MSIQGRYSDTVTRWWIRGLRGVDVEQGDPSCHGDVVENAVLDVNNKFSVVADLK